MAASTTRCKWVSSPFVLIYAPNLTSFAAPPKNDGLAQGLLSAAGQHVDRFANLSENHGY